MFYDYHLVAIAFIVAVFVTIMILVARHNRKRRQQYANWAARRGFSLDPERIGEMESEYPGLGCLRTGTGRYAYDLLTGEWRDHPFRAFHYHYETHSTDSKGRTQTHHHHLTVVSVEPEFPLQHLDIRPEGIFDKVASFFGAEDINFESAAFSRRFHVSAKNRRWAFDILHARSMQFLLARPACSIQLNDHYAAAWFSDVYAPAKVEATLDTLCGLLEAVPDYVRKQQLDGPVHDPRAI